MSYHLDLPWLIHTLVLSLVAWLASEPASLVWVTKGNLLFGSDPSLSYPLLLLWVFAGRC